MKFQLILATVLLQSFFVTATLLNDLELPNCNIGPKFDPEKCVDDIHEHFEEFQDMIFQNDEHDPKKNSERKKSKKSQKDVISQKSTEKMEDEDCPEGEQLMKKKNSEDEKSKKSQKDAISQKSTENLQAEDDIEGEQLMKKKNSEDEKEFAKEPTIWESFGAIIDDFKK